MNNLIPKVPILSKMAAKIIDPKTGASTCALGSHIWVKYIGVLTKNAVIKVMVKKKQLDEVVIGVLSIKFSVRFILFWVKNIKLKRRGNEAENV